MNRLAWFFFVAAVAFYITTPILDPDLWWHIVVGRWIIWHRQLPLVDIWTVFGSGTVWRAYSWTTEILFAGIEDYLGLHGLLALKCLFALLLALSFSAAFSGIAKDYFLGTLLGLYTTIACYNHFTLRPQVLVWAYFAWLLYTCAKIEERGLGLRERFSLVCIMALWANTHISSVLGIVAVALWCLGRGSYSLAVLSALYAVLGTLLTPYLGGEWITFAQTASHPFAHASIIEFQPATLHQYATGFLVLLCALVATFFHHRPRLFNNAQLLLLAIFVAGAFAVVKFIPFALLVAGALLARYFAIEAQRGLEATALSGAFQRLRVCYEWLPKPGLSFILLSFVIVRAFALWQHPLDEVVTPKAALDFLQEKKLPAPLLNTFGGGGYILYRTANERGEVPEKVVIDGRTNLITAELWAKFANALNGNERWREFIELIHPKTILWKWESPLTSILRMDHAWCLVFKSGRPEKGHVIFVRREALAAGLDGLTLSDCK